MKNIFLLDIRVDINLVLLLSNIDVLLLINDDNYVNL